MILSFTAITSNAQFRDFSCQFTELETALDFLGSVTLQGDTIIKAHILDDDKRVELASEAFDGKSFTEPLHQLEKQWQAILSKPRRSSQANNQWHIDLTRQRIKLYDTRIEQITRMVLQVELLCLRTEEMLLHEPRRDNLVSYYRSMLDMYCQQINQAQASKQQVQKKLKQLESCVV
ncbi:hypothetical protein [Spirosoma validum]|uniref:Uncharacterized protein n=1 Tax=Spirosoma validum TaxID=2771355 RepID=A0A927B128_9BACT|nr:hypothetical protein [Spirosoma validum]MBD2753393.1 hypothetical protein [Spirosoma validum]